MEQRFQYNKSGDIIWREPPEKFVNAAECLNLIDDQCSLASKASITFEPFDESVNFKLGSFHIGGNPDWLQSPAVFNCTKCGNEMTFVLQLPSEALDPSRSVYGEYLTGKKKEMVRNGIRRISDVD